MIPIDVLHRWKSRVGLALTLLAFAVSPVPAEVSVDGSGGNRVTAVVMGISDGPDPFSGGVWQVYRPISIDRILNPDGAIRGDGSPHLSVSIATGGPVAVWAYATAADHDIAFSEWNGSVWTATEFVTWGLDDDLDPRVHSDPSGDVHVTWWTPGSPDTVYLSTRAGGGSSWSLPVSVTELEQFGRRPSVVVAEGVLYIAYERPCASGCAQEIAIAKRNQDGTFVHSVVATTGRTDRLDPVLHGEGNQVWVDWKEGGGRFGLSRLEDGVWNQRAPTDGFDTTWVGVEDTRKAVRRQALVP